MSSSSRTGRCASKSASRRTYRAGCRTTCARTARTEPGAELAWGFGLVQGDGGANERLQRLLVYLLALAEVDGTPSVSVQTGVEEARRILQCRRLGEGHLHDVLV